MSSKLAALQHELMTNAARREDRLLTVPSNLRGDVRSSGGRNSVREQGMIEEMVDRVTVEQSGLTMPA